MTEADVTRIESELNVRLPADYRGLLLDPPFAPLDEGRVYWLYDDPDTVIAATRFPLNEFYDGKGWIPSYLAIGETAMGDQYLIDLDRSPSPVFCLSHETHEVEPDYPDLPAFVAGWNEELATARRHRRPIRRGRWWKFW
jgi:hypothetical protein